MIFAGGLHINGTYQFAARLYQLFPRKGVSIMSVVVTGKSSGLDSITWDLPAALVDHASTNSTIKGYEDPRLESVQGRLKIVASAPFQTKSNRCPNKDYSRHQVFIPLDNPERRCMIRVTSPGIHPCQVQKNWVPFVPRGSPDLFMVFSLEPFQVLKFNESRCEARLVPGGKVQPWAVNAYHGGTRYVHGFDVPSGAVYWSMAHTHVSDRFRAVLVAVLARAEGADGYTFERIGLSRPFFLEKIPLNGGFAYVHSIFDFNLTSDTATIGLHVNDRLNLVSRVKGVTPWLRGVFEEYLAKNHTPV